MTNLENSVKIQELKAETYIFNRGNCTLTVFPIVHESIFYSQRASERISQINPDVVAIELPKELENKFTEAVMHLPKLSILYNESMVKPYKQLIPGTYYIIHPGEALYWSMRSALLSGIPVKCIDFYNENSKPTINLQISPLQVPLVGWYKVFENLLPELKNHANDYLHGNRSRNFAFQLDKMAKEGYQNIVFICGGAHLLALASHLSKIKFELKDYKMKQFLTKINTNNLEEHRGPEIPFISSFWKMELLRSRNLHHYLREPPFLLAEFAENPKGFDYFQAIQELVFTAGKNYHENFSDDVSLSSYLKLFQYLRNLSYVYINLIPQLIHIIYAAKGMVDDDYAYEVYKLASSYMNPDQKDESDYFELPPSSNIQDFVKVAFKRRFRKSVLKDHTEDEQYDIINYEQYDGEWEDIWEKYSKYGFVSYPPEDKFIEDYMEKIRKQINQILSEENSSSLEFQASIEDGIDYRMTARRYHEGKIYVKKYPHNVEEIGALILQFEEEPLDLNRYTHYSTLFAEHDQESHISVLITTPGTEFIGPGICRVQYAALVSQFPPIGMPYLISNNTDDFKLRLTETAMRMSLSKIIGFVAKKPPSPQVYSFAGSNGFRLIYIPLTQLTKLSLHRLRTMHLLAHRDLRDVAREYIGF